MNEVKTLRIVFHLERGGVFFREIRLPEPRVEEGELLRPIQVLLDSLKTGSSVIGLTLDAETTLPSAAPSAAAALRASAACG